MSDQEVVDECNALAREFYALMGYQVRVGYQFHKATHPQEVMVWNMAVIAFECLRDTDVEDARLGIEE